MHISVVGTVVKIVSAKCLVAMEMISTRQSLKLGEIRSIGF